MRILVLAAVLAQAAPAFDVTSVKPNTGTQDFVDPPDAGPSLFTVIEEQLGLKLEPTRAPVGIMVIDGAERPAGD